MAVAAQAVTNCLLFMFPPFRIEVWPRAQSFLAYWPLGIDLPPIVNHIISNNFAADFEIHLTKTVKERIVQTCDSWIASCIPPKSVKTVAKAHTTVGIRKA